MNKFDELIQAVREKAKANPSEPVRADKTPKHVPAERPAERQVKLPYSSNPKPLGGRWKQVD